MPWRTIIGAVAVVVATFLSLYLLLAAIRIVTWIAIAGFMAIVLAPPVTRSGTPPAWPAQPCNRHGGVRHAGVIAGVIALFIMPVRTQLVDIITDLPGTVHDAADGKGPVGNIVHKLHVESYVKDNEAKLASAAARLSDSSFEYLPDGADRGLRFHHDHPADLPVPQPIGGDRRGCSEPHPVSKAGVGATHRNRCRSRRQRRTSSATSSSA